MIEQLEKLKSESKALSAQVKEKTVGYITAALGLVAGLAWNDAIKALIEHFFPAKGTDLAARFTYAAIITLIVVVATVYLMRLAKRGEQEKRK